MFETDVYLYNMVVICRSRGILEQNSPKALALCGLRSMNHSLKHYHSDIWLKVECVTSEYQIPR